MNKQLRVSFCPSMKFPMEVVPFYVPVKDIEEAKKIVETLTGYQTFLEKSPLGNNFLGYSTKVEEYNSEEKQWKTWKDKNGNGFYDYQSENQDSYRELCLINNLWATNLEQLNKLKIKLVGKVFKNNDEYIKAVENAIEEIDDNLEFNYWDFDYDRIYRKKDKYDYLYICSIFTSGSLDDEDMVIIEDIVFGDSVSIYQK